MDKQQDDWISERRADLGGGTNPKDLMRRIEQLEKSVAYLEKQLQRR